MRWTTRSRQLDARWLQVNFFVNYCFIRSHSLKPTHCRSAGRQATNTHTFMGATFRPDSSSDCGDAWSLCSNVGVYCLRTITSLPQKVLLLIKDTLMRCYQFYAIASVQAYYNEHSPGHRSTHRIEESQRSARTDRTDTYSHPEMCTFWYIQVPDMLFGYTSGKQCVAKAVTAIVLYTHTHTPS